MVFCGRCGIQLAPGSSRCPRCGALSEVNVIGEDPHMNDATVISPRRDDQLTYPAQPGYGYPTGATPVPPAHTIVRSADPTSLDIIDPNAPTSMSSRPGGTSTPFPSSDPISYPSYSSPSTPGQYQNWQTPPPQEPKRRGGFIALVIVVLVILLALGGTAAAVLNPALIQGLLGGQPTPTPATTATTPAAIATSPATATSASTPTPTPMPTATQQARATIEQYYTYVNAQDYQDAYNIWGSAEQAAQPYNGFVAGYANTIHDNVTITSLTEQPDGTVIADVTLQANEQSSSGPVVNTYQGWYKIGIENGSWKFLDAKLSKTS